MRRGFGESKRRCEWRDCAGLGLGEMEAIRTQAHGQACGKGCDWELRGWSREKRGFGRGVAALEKTGDAQGSSTWKWKLLSQRASRSSSAAGRDETCGVGPFLMHISIHAHPCISGAVFFDTAQSEREHLAGQKSDISRLVHCMLISKTATGWRDGRWPRHSSIKDPGLGYVNTWPCFRPRRLIWLGPFRVFVTLCMAQLPKSNHRLTGPITKCLPMLCQTLKMVDEMVMSRALSPKLASATQPCEILASPCWIPNLTPSFWSWCFRSVGEAMAKRWSKFPPEPRGRWNGLR